MKKQESIIVINRIIDDRKTKYSEIEDAKFYEDCRNKFIKTAEKGVDFSECKTFSDLCNVQKNEFLKEVVNESEEKKYGSSKSIS